MASYTPNLDLLKKSPVTDGDDMFNVETMLNENWDRIDRGVGDYTAPAQKMGLTGDLSVGASLGVLANIGNVHVWRKTVTTEEEVPAGYKLVDDNTDRTLDDVPNALINLGNSNQRTAYINCADSITVDDGGGISLNSATTHYQANDALNAASWLRGKYIKLYYINDFGNWFGPPALDQNKTYYVPNDAQISVNSATIIVDKLQRVDAYPLTPPGTHITYLTSTNRNAYQEGDNEVPAKYELGPIIEESYKVVGLSSGQNQESYRYGDTPQVSIDGVILPDSLKNGITLYCTAESANTANSTLRGKFLIRPGSFSNANFPVNKVVFIPLDALFTYNEGGDYYLYLDKYQEVIGVPGVPANTSIEYLGVLGDPGKQIVFGEFIGDNTAGREIKLGFKPSMVVLIPHSYINLRIDLGTTDTPFWCMVPGCDYETSAYPLSEEYMYITEKGFIVSYDSDASEIYWNQQYKSYYYLALE